MVDANNKVTGIEMGKKNVEASSSLKYASLLVLIFQNACLILMIRYSRTLDGDMYISSTAVVAAEVIKLLTCIVLSLFEVKDFTKWLSMFYVNVIADPMATLMVAVPSFIYVIQNNLQFVAISNLDAATFQVTYQIKILTTALFSVFLLNKNLVKLQWFSLGLLFVGVAMVQMQTSKVTVKESSQNPLVGLIAVLISSVCSGFAGVYFERILKHSGHVSIWWRNIQLGLFGMLLGTFGMLLNDRQKIVQHGVFFGYTKVVWIVILMQAFGGLLVAVVVKHADNILKGFATSFAIILSCVISIFVFDFVLTLQFAGGAFLVILAIFIYGKAALK